MKKPKKPEIMPVILRLEQVTTHEDPNASWGINALGNARGHITALYGLYGELEGLEYREYQLAERKRKNAFIEAKIKYMGEGNSATKAEAFAEKDCKDLYDAEIDAESNYRVSKIRREIYDKQLSLLNQLISIVKQEMGQAENQFLKGK